MLLENSGLDFSSVGVLTGPPAGVRRASESAVEANRLEANAGLVEDMVLPPMRGECGAGDAERAGERLHDNTQQIKARNTKAALDRQQIGLVLQTACHSCLANTYCAEHIGKPESIAVPSLAALKKPCGQEC
jgi:hypothetical protein